MDDQSQGLVALAFTALDHAVDCVVSTGEDLVPFVMRETNGQRSLNRYLAGDDLGESVAAARESAQAKPVPDRIALAWDGFLTTDDGRMEAIFVECYENTAPSGFVIAQRYQKSGLQSPANEVVGNPALVNSKTTPLF